MENIIWLFHVFYFEKIELYNSSMYRKLVFVKVHAKVDVLHCLTKMVFLVKCL